MQFSTAAVCASCLAITVWFAAAQTKPDTAEAHRAAAKVAAGTDLMGIYDAACPTPGAPGARGGQRGPGAAPGTGAGAARGTPRPDPPRDQWYAEPAKVFDNLYFLGTKVHESWAITTSDGIIVIDALFGYAVEPEVVEGMKKLGLDPKQIKYVIVSHGHGDHSGGAKFLQDTFQPHLVMGPLDWDMLEKGGTPANPAPKRDIEATDGMKIKLGDETVTLYITPGHTGSTISTLVPVKDGGKTHLAAEWGGTVISPRTSIPMLESYVKNAERFMDLAIGSGADVIITNHTAFDGTLLKNEALEKRKPGDPNPWIVGKDAVRRYLTVAAECGKANLIEAKALQQQ
jgi:metallo-beta-lactamase class B